MPTNTKDINKDFFLQLTSVDTLASHSTYLIPFLPPFKSPLLPHMELTICIIPSYGQQASGCTTTNMEAYNTSTSVTKTQWNWHKNFQESPECFLYIGIQTHHIYPFCAPEDTRSCL